MSYIKSGGFSPGTSRDFRSCPCPGTKGHRDKETIFCPRTKQGTAGQGNFFVQEQRDNGMSRHGLGNPTLNTVKRQDPYIYVCKVEKMLMYNSQHSARFENLNFPAQN